MSREYCGVLNNDARRYLKDLRTELRVLSMQVRRATPGQKAYVRRQRSLARMEISELWANQ